MTGISNTLAPRAASGVDNSAACWRNGVTTTLEPDNGRALPAGPERPARLSPSLRANLCSCRRQGQGGWFNLTKSHTHSFLAFKLRGRIGEFKNQGGQVNKPCEKGREECPTNRRNRAQRENGRAELILPTVP